jgi:hypothetical protein
MTDDTLYVISLALRLIGLLILVYGVLGYLFLTKNKDQ